mgnify:CR=1 FL=1
MRTAGEQRAPGHRLRRVLWLLCVFATLARSPALIAQDEPESQVPSTQGIVEPPAELPAAHPDPGVNAQPGSTPDAETESKRKRLRAVVGMLVLALVCFVFLVLILVVIVWARRIRKLTHKALPDQHPGDPLWYLKSRSGTHSTDNDTQP